MENWSENNIYGYHSLVEWQRSYDEKIHWNVVNPAYNVVSLNDGYWDFVFKRLDMRERVQSVSAFHVFLQTLHIPMVYVQAPGKINKYGQQDAWLRNRYDFSNNNADRLLSGLRQHGIDTIDLRDYFHRTVPEEQYHQLFFRTDHHWLPQTALSAASFTAHHLHENYGIEINFSNLNLQQYRIENLPAFFLGSSGKKISLARTKPDDFPMLHTDFPTSIHLEIPSKDVNSAGTFEITYDKDEIAGLDYYNQHPYAAYGYGDQPFLAINNLNLSSYPDQKILVIKDSFGDTMVPLLSMGSKDITAIDLRHFTGSLHTLVEKLRPNVVVILYTDHWDNSINWDNHSDAFDFR